MDYFKIIANSTPLNLRPSYVKLEKYVGGTVNLKSYGSGGVPPYQYAFYVTGNNGVNYKGTYTKNNTLDYRFYRNGSYTITAFIKDAKGNRIVKKLSPFYVYSTPQYKALVIGQYNYAEELAGVDIDVREMTNFFKTRGPYGAMPVSTYMDQSAYGIISAISNTFTNTQPDSVSIFYYLGHGASDGSLCGTDGSYLIPSELASELNKLQGKVIVILDSCYSGNYIGKGQSFNQSAINAFARIDTTAKFGELLSNKFHVITGSSYYNSSYSNNEYGGLLSYGIRNANDYDSNGFISMHEAYTYSKYFTQNVQTVQCYPLNDNLPLVK